MVAMVRLPQERGKRENEATHSTSSKPWCSVYALPPPPFSFRSFLCECRLVAISSSSSSSSSSPSASPSYVFKEHVELLWILVRIHKLDAERMVPHQTQRHLRFTIIIIRIIILCPNEDFKTSNNQVNSLSELINVQTNQSPSTMTLPFPALPGGPLPFVSVEAVKMT